jgi:hypothetical protein
VGGFGGYLKDNPVAMYALEGIDFISGPAVYAARKGLTELTPAGDWIEGAQQTLIGNVADRMAATGYNSTDATNGGVGALTLMTMAVGRGAGAATRLENVASVIANVKSRLGDAASNVARAMQEVRFAPSGSGFVNPRMQIGAVGNVGNGGPAAGVNSGSTVAGPRGPYRGGAHGQTKFPRNDGLDSHHSPDRNADPRVTADEGPAIQMDPRDHTWTSSNGQNGRAGAIYRAQTADMISQGRYRDAMAREIIDIRRAAMQGSGQMTKYNEAVQEMLEYARSSGQLPPNNRTGR